MTPIVLTVWALVYSPFTDNAYVIPNLVSEKACNELYDKIYNNSYFGHRYKCISYESVVGYEKR